MLFLFKKPELDIFSNKELNVINNVILKLSGMDSSEITDYSQKDNPLIISKVDEEIDYEGVFYRDSTYGVRVYDDE